MSTRLSASPVTTAYETPSDFPVSRPDRAPGGPAGLVRPGAQLNRQSVYHLRMCCFSGPVQDVSNTKIFARATHGAQLLAYQMTFSTTTDLAMILPLPVPKG